MRDNTEAIMALATKLAYDSAEAGAKAENERIIELLLDLGGIRRDALGHLVAFNTEGTKVIYLPGLERESK